MAQLHLHEGDVEALRGDEVSRVRATERVKVEAGREPKLVEQPMEHIKQMRPAQDGSR